MRFLTFLLPLFAFCQVYHPNGIMATSGDPTFTFFHENGQVAWFGRNHLDKRFFYKNGAVAWQGKFPKECYYSYDNSSIFHNNGKVAWKGATHRDTSFSYDPCTVYYNNGNVAWKGSLYKDSSWGYGPCTVYYRDGSVAWKGAWAKECPYSSDPCTIYHANGKPAWRGNFSYETATLYSSAIFYDNGQMAWSGKRGDPIYDPQGFISTHAAEAINLPLANGSWLYVSHNGYAWIHINLGEESFLTFSNADQNPRLLMQLGTGLALYCYPYTGQIPEMVVYENTAFPVR